ncbi:hypothetical protein [Streptomyces jumonjinensis]|uniref:hypothetical protein n=1 Tax=Streptomyces jumonjinensis TaxID=1945 RepID=UPI0037910252
MLVLPSCTVRHPPEHTSSRPPSAWTSSFRLPLPFDAYKWNPRETWLRERARRLLAEHCLQARGIDLNLPGATPEPPDSYDNSRRYGVGDIRAASRFGYHPPEMWSGGQPQWAERLSAEEEAALYGAESDPGCYHQADSALSRGTPAADTSWLATQSSRTLLRSSATAEVNQARSSWSTCMKQAGYAYTHPDKAIGDPQWDLDSRTVTARETETARADVRCKRSSGLLRLWHTTESAAQRRVIARHRAVFESLTANKQAQLKNAARALEARR